MMPLAEIHWQTPDTSSLTLSWQTLAAMVSISSVVSTAAMIYLRAVWGRDLTTAVSGISKELAVAQVNVSDRVRADVKEALAPIDRRVERLEEKLSRKESE